MSPYKRASDERGDGAALLPHEKQVALQPNPFDSIDSAHEYVGLLGEAIDDAICETAGDAQNVDVERQRDALRLVSYKLHQLRAHVTASSRLLNDLRTLRRLLLHERVEATATASLPTFR